MKKFITKTILFSLVALIIYEAVPIYNLYTGKYKSTVAGWGIYHAISKSNQKNDSNILILGDSVGGQLFSNLEYYDDINSLATNQAVSLVGQYILLNNYITAGNKIETVFIIMNPFSFGNNLDQVYTFHYFMKPFYKARNYEHFTSTVFNQIKKIPKNYLHREPSVLTSNWAPEFTSKDEKEFTFLSPISVEYLIKIKNLGEKNNINIVILPTPVSFKQKNLISNFDKQEITRNGLNELFKYYFDRIIYLDESLFSDGVHLIEPIKYTRIYKNKWIN